MSPPSPERAIRRVYATALRRDAERLASEWVDLVVEACDVARRDALPTEEILDHIPFCLKRIAESIESGTESEVAVIRGKMSRLADLRSRQGYDVDQLLEEFDDLYRVLSDWTITTSSELPVDVDRLMLVKVVVSLKTAFRRMEAETLRAFRTWSSRKFSEVVFQAEALSIGLQHQLMNELGAAITAVELLREMGTESERERRLNKLISEALDDVHETVNLLRTVLTHLDADEPAWVPLPNLLGRLAYGIIVRDAERLEIDLKFDPVPDVLVASPHISMLLRNLIDNAIKYHDGAKNRQWIRVSAEQECAVDETPEWVRITVEDNGSGMGPELRRTAFDWGVRGATSVAGEGLGLAMVKAIITSLGGSVTVESQLSVGTRFVVTLPARPRGGGSR